MSGEMDEDLKKKVLDKLNETSNRNFNQITGFKELGDSGGTAQIYQTILSNGMVVIENDICVKMQKEELKKKKGDDFKKEIQYHEELSENIGPKFIGSIDDQLYIIERGCTLHDVISKIDYNIKPLRTLDDWKKKFVEAYWKRLPTERHIFEELKRMLVKLSNIVYDLHAKKKIHLDIKPENILIVKRDDDFFYCLFDFGSMKNIDEWMDETKIYVTYDNLPEQIKNAINLNECTSHNRIELKVKDIKAYGCEYGEMLDRHNLSKVIYDLVRGNKQYGVFQSLVSSRDKETLIEIARCFRLSDNPGDKLPNEVRKDLIDKAQKRLSGNLNLDPSADGRVCFTATELFDKIEESSNYISNQFKSGMMSLPPRDLNHYDSNIKTMSETLLFKRLNKIKQLGFVSHVFVNATHTRYQHSLGAFQMTINYLDNLLRHKGSVWLALRVKEKDILMILLYALLHDIGHYPYAHYLEQIEGFPSHGEITKQILICNHNSDDIVGEIINNVIQSQSGDANQLTIEMIKNYIDADYYNKINDIIKQFHEQLKILYNLEPNDWQAWFNLMTANQNDSELINFYVQYTLLQCVEGPVNADTFDYIFRDSYYCKTGLEGGIEEDLFLKNLTIHSDIDHSPEVKPYSICVREEARCAFEQIVLRRYHLFCSVYWDVRCRMHHALFQDIIKEIGKLGDFNKFIVKWIVSSSDHQAQKLLKNSVGDDEALRAKIYTLLNNRNKINTIMEIMQDEEMLYSAFEYANENNDQDDSCEKNVVIDSIISVTNITKDHEDVRNNFEEIISKKKAELKNEIILDCPKRSVGSFKEDFCGIVLSDGTIKKPGPIANKILSATEMWAKRCRVFKLNDSYDEVTKSLLKQKIKEKISRKPRILLNNF